MIPNLDQISKTIAEFLLRNDFQPPLTFAMIGVNGHVFAGRFESLKADKMVNFIAITGKPNKLRFPCNILLVDGMGKAWHICFQNRTQTTPPLVSGAARRKNRCTHNVPTIFLAAKGGEKGMAIKHQGESLMEQSHKIVEEQLNRTKEIGRVLRQLFAGPISKKEHKAIEMIFIKSFAEEAAAVDRLIKEAESLVRQRKPSGRNKEKRKRASRTGKDREETRAKRTCGDLQG